MQVVESPLPVLMLIRCESPIISASNLESLGGDDLENGGILQPC